MLSIIINIVIVDLSFELQDLPLAYPQLSWFHVQDCDNY